MISILFTIYFAILVTMFVFLDQVTIMRLVTCVDKALSEMFDIIFSDLFSRNTDKKEQHPPK